MGRGPVLEKLPKYVSAYSDRHGKRRYRFRRAGADVALKEHPGTPRNPSAEYKALLSGLRPANDVPRAAAGTIDDLVQRFYGSGAFAGGNHATRAKNRAILERFRQEHGSKRAAKVGFHHIEAMVVARARVGVDDRGRKTGGPFAAERFRKLLRRLFELAVKMSGTVPGYEGMTVNPVEIAVLPATPRTQGFHTWSDDEIERFRAFHPVGTKPRLALELLRWTMQRGGDARTFSAGQRRGGLIEIWNEKTGKPSWAPEPRQLTEAIRAMPAVGAATLLVTDFGKPFSQKGFGQWFKRQCVKAGLAHCTAHGLRKATARQLADHVDATQQELKAAGGWSGDREVATYVAAADKKRLATNALTRLAEWDLSNHDAKVRQSRDATPSED